MTGQSFWSRVLGMPPASWNKLDREYQAGIERSAKSFERKMAQADPEHPARRMIDTPTPTPTLKQGRRSILDEVDADQRRLSVLPKLFRHRHRQP
jgi:hypothetical protein